MRREKKIALIGFILLTGAIALGGWIGYFCFVSRYESYDCVRSNVVCDAQVAAHDEDITFALARLDKIKAGPFALGNLSRLSLKDLTITYRPIDVKSVFDTSKIFQYLMGFYAQKFETAVSRANLSLQGVVAVRIKGLSVYRLDPQAPMPVLFADEAYSRGLTLVLENCCLYENGRTNRLGQATVSVSTDPRLVWSQGERTLLSLMTAVDCPSSDPRPRKK